MSGGQRIAVVGAGVAGLACARVLAAAGQDVAVFDKARGLGGRASTHRNGAYAFDSGAQFFDGDDPAFGAEIERWRAAGVVREWTGSVVEIAGGETRATEARTRWVGVPGMSAIAADLARGLDVTRQFRAERIVRGRDGLRLVAADGRTAGAFDVVASTAPAAQTAALVQESSPAVAETVSSVGFCRCVALMVAFEERVPWAHDAAVVHDPPAAWIARDSSKPARPAPDAWVVHATATWSERHFDGEDAALRDSLRDALAVATGSRLGRVAYERLHRWRYALADAPLAERCVFDAGAGVGAAGDWCGGARIEDAYLSGAALAGRILARSSARLGDARRP